MKQLSVSVMVVMVTMATESPTRLHRHSHGDYGDGDELKTLSGGWMGGTDTPAATASSQVVVWAKFYRWLPNIQP